jgi:ataxia telangiectasia mutated family protein
MGSEGGDGHLTDERCRQLVDAAVLAIAFESSLVRNGMRSTRRVLQSACKLITTIIPLLASKRWTREEQAAVLLGFEPLVSAGEEDEDEGWGGLMAPTKSTGIRREAWTALTDTTKEARAHARTKRRELLRIIWQSADVSLTSEFCYFHRLIKVKVQDVLADVMKAMKSILRALMTRLAGDPASKVVLDVDAQDGFEPTSFTPLATQTAGALQASANSPAQSIVSICITFLATGPSLQSSTEGPTRDRELSDILLNSEGEEFLVAGPAYLSNVRRGSLSISVTVLDNILDKIESLLRQYAYSRNDTLHRIAVSLLDSTMELWLQKDTAVETLQKVQDILHWLCKALEDHSLRSWHVRDSAVAFLRRYIMLDPQEAIWNANYDDANDSQDAEDDEDLPKSPFALLPALNSDPDIRVRFRAAKAMAILFQAPNRSNDESIIVYDAIRGTLCNDLQKCVKAVSIYCRPSYSPSSKLRAHALADLNFGKHCYCLCGSRTRTYLAHNRGLHVYHWLRQPHRSCLRGDCIAHEPSRSIGPYHDLRFTNRVLHS